LHKLKQGKAKNRQEEIAKARGKALVTKHEGEKGYRRKSSHQTRQTLTSKLVEMK